MTEQNGVKRSSVIDELRNLADGQATYRDAREAMLKAADTIDFMLDSKRIAEHRVTELLEQNAKLRELAKGLYEFAYAEYPSAAKAGFADDLRELGVEVEG